MHNPNADVGAPDPNQNNNNNNSNPAYALGDIVGSTVAALGEAFTGGDAADDTGAEAGAGAVPGGGGGGGGKKKKKTYDVPTLPSATSQEDYVNSMYNAYQAQNEANLRSAYEQNMNTLNATAEKIPGTYNAAADQAAAQAAINRQNFNEYAAANGLNTGAGAQARLAQNNALQGNIASIRKAQADAVADIDLQRAQLETEYKNSINQALANNDLARAQALYQEAVRVDESLVNTARDQANLDWTVWHALYG